MIITAEHTDENEFFFIMKAKNSLFSENPWKRTNKVINQGKTNRNSGCKSITMEEHFILNYFFCITVLYVQFAHAQSPSTKGSFPEAAVKKLMAISPVNSRSREFCKSPI